MEGKKQLDYSLDVYNAWLLTHTLDGRGCPTKKPLLLKFKKSNPQRGRSATTQIIYKYPPPLLSLLKAYRK
jgi:hypothetical protein